MRRINDMMTLKGRQGLPLSRGASRRRRVGGGGGVIPPVPPTPIPVTYFSAGNWGRLYRSARDLSLEPSVSGVDRPMSWCYWVRGQNQATWSQRLYGVGNQSTGDCQYVANLGAVSATATRVFNFVLYGTFPGVYIGKYTSFKILSARVNFIVVTYSGSETNAGIKIYVNGVEDTSAIPTLGGSYAGLLSSSNNRFFVGANNNSAGRFVGDVRDFSVWNRVLTGGEVIDLYNGGSPPDVDTMPFYAADITAYWPLRTNFFCLNNGSLNLDVNPSSFVTLRTLSFGSNYPYFTIYNPSPGNTSYNAFGTILQLSPTVQKGFVRSGTDHVTNGDVVNFDFNGSSYSISTPVVRISETPDLRDGDGGIVGSDVVIFTSSYTSPAGPSIELLRYESTDGLTGNAFGPKTVMATTYNRYTTYGKVIEGPSGEVWFPWYETDLTTYQVCIYKRSAAGVWTNEVVYSGTTSFTEACFVLDIATGKQICVARRNSGGLWRSFKPNYGTPWSVFQNTNLVSGVGMADMCWDEFGTIVIVFGDRTDFKLKISLGNSIDDIIANASGWHAASDQFVGYPTDSLGILGYPSIIRSDKEYSLIFSAEFSSTRADIIAGVGRLY